MCFPNLDVSRFTSFTRFQDYLLGSELRNGFLKSQIFRHKILSSRIRWHRVWEIKQKSIQIFVLAAREWRKELNAVTEWILHEVDRVLAASNGVRNLCDIIFERTRRQTSSHTWLSLKRWHFQLKTPFSALFIFKRKAFSSWTLTRLCLNQFYDACCPTVFRRCCLHVQSIVSFATSLQKIWILRRLTSGGTSSVFSAVFLSFFKVVLRNCANAVQRI